MAVGTAEAAAANGATETVDIVDGDTIDVFLLVGPDEAVVDMVVAAWSEPAWGFPMQCKTLPSSNLYSGTASLESFSTINRPRKINLSAFNGMLVALDASFLNSVEDAVLLIRNGTRGLPAAAVIVKWMVMVLASSVSDMILCCVSEKEGRCIDELGDEDKIYCD
jgi:hypothetical protein